MSRLYASIESDARKTPATSRGHKEIESHTRGWHNGIRVVARATDSGDVFDVYRTGGSNANESDQLIGTLSSDWVAAPFDASVEWAAAE